MKTLSRDVTITLIVKFCLLFALWFICIKPFHQSKPISSQWILEKQYRNKSNASQAVTYPAKKNDLNLTTD